MHKKIIQNNFASKAAIYNDCADIQKNAAQNLCEIAKNFISNSNKILDLGSGTSFIAKNLISTHQNLQIFEIDFAINMLKHWPNKPQNVLPILADIENLPFKNHETFDIILSSFALQWIENFDELFVNLQKILKKNGYLVFCIPDEKSFSEIKDANIKSGCNFFFKKLPKIELIKAALAKNQFKEKLLDYKIATKHHKNAVLALREIKNIGANYSNYAIKKPITKKSLQKFNDLFLQDSQNNLSWHLYYLIYQK